MAASAAQPAARPSDRWLFGPAPDLLLGCGLLYALAFAAHALAGPSLRQLTPGYLLPMMILLFSAPHYGGTLLRVYEQRRDRQAYAIFSVWFTLALLALFFVALRSPFLGSVLFTLYLTWSPWHYSGQNYGLAVMFLRRRRVALEPTTKRWLYATFVLSFVLAALVMHLQVGVAYSPVAYEGEQVTFLPVGITRDVGDWVLPIVAVAYLTSLVMSAALLRRVASWSDLLPTGALMLTQALWFAAPFSVHYWGWKTGIEPLDAQRAIATYTLMIFVGHGIQYLWVTTYYARAGGAWRGYWSYWLKAAAAGTAVWQLPVLLIAPTNLTAGAGYAGSLLLLIATFVNLHHFVLDGAIWKLRSSRIAGVLIRSAPEEPDGEAAPTWPWLRRAVWGTAAVGFACASIGFTLTRVYVPPALDRGDLDLAERALDFSSRLGTDEALLRSALAERFRRDGELERAVRHAQRLVALRPDGESYALLGRLESTRGNAEAARTALETALAERVSRLDRVHGQLASLALARGDETAAARHWMSALQARPSSTGVANNLAWLLATAEDVEVRDPATAVTLAEKLVERSDDPNHHDTLAAAYAAAGRYRDAVDAAARAEQLAVATPDAALLASIRENLARYRASHEEAMTRAN